MPMDLGSAVAALGRDPELVAWRDRGVAIRVTETHQVQRILVAKPYHYQPAFPDIIALDWQIGTLEQLKARWTKIAEGQEA